MESIIQFLIFIPSISFFFLINSSFAMKPLCHQQESTALLQFKQSFTIESFNSKTESWNLEGENYDCCSWVGVECDEESGFVIGLDLGNNYLYGSIDSTSTLFQLVHLQRLDLSNNHFNYSLIPSEFGQLSRLEFLNLSSSYFSGEIPFEISQLGNLKFLSLSENVELKLGNLFSLTSLIKNLARLEELDLSWVDIPSSIPVTMSNLSSLRSLRMENCGLNGDFPTGIFQLPNLMILHVEMNPNLTGFLPTSIGNLEFLNEFDISNCSFSGEIPSSLGNLSRLSHLDLSFNKFTGSSLGFGVSRLTKLTHLGLNEIQLNGADFLNSISYLTQLSYLGLASSNLTGSIPYELMNLTKLTSLDLNSNQFTGEIPSSLVNLIRLAQLDLSFNKLNGNVMLDMFHKFKNLYKLHLSFNNLSLISKPRLNSTVSVPQLLYLGLASCDLNEFPDFLLTQNRLLSLDLSHNNIQGQIPQWLMNKNIETLRAVNLSHNFLTSFVSPPEFLPWINLQTLDMSSNMLQSPLPIPRELARVILLSKNNLSGNLSPLICNLSSLQVLDLSDNNMSGTLPSCLGHFSYSLSVLNIRGNDFGGKIPNQWENCGSLSLLELGENQLQGEVPRSLANCKLLKFISLGNNQILDTFPKWLGNLPELSILNLRFNGFHGVIGEPETDLDFPKLRLLEISYNNFTGRLPSKYFQIWNAMKVVDTDSIFTYMTTPMCFVDDVPCVGSYDYSLKITNKGMERIYWKTPDSFRGIDFSSNRFEGEIPNSIGDLKGLMFLNISNNNLISFIPNSLQNLKRIESLDLSNNQLSGPIPEELKSLTSLSFFNVSNNDLVGHIPQGNQFDTFEESSYMGNSGLCGNPLTNPCKKVEIDSPFIQDFEGRDDEDFPSKYDLIVILMGYGSGLIVGLILGHILNLRKIYQRFRNIFGMHKKETKRNWFHQHI